MLGVSNGVAELTLNRPQVGNAVNHAMVDRLELLLTDLEARDDVAALVVRGAGERFFCAGGDLDEYPRLDTEGARRLSLRMQVVTDRISRLPMLTVAALNGHVVGGGLEIALACDLRVADAGSRLVRPEIGMGLVPPWGGLHRMRDLVGRARTLHLLLVENTVEAVRAREVGLVDVVAERSAVESATALARAVVALPRPSVRAALRLLDGGGDACDVADTFGRLWSGDAHRATQRRWQQRRDEPIGPA